MLIAQIHGIYRVFDAVVVGLGRGRKGGDVGAGVLKAAGRRGRDRWRFRVEIKGGKGETSYNGKVCS